HFLHFLHVYLLWTVHGVLHMSIPQFRLTSSVMAGALAVFVASFVTSAQTPAPGGQAQTPVAPGAGAGQGAPNPAAGQGARGGGGGGRGGGAEALAGGPQLDDPAYANY